MANWGWRPCVLFVFISVLITGCGDDIHNRPTSSPTDLPPLTLIVRTPAKVPPTSVGLPTSIAITHSPPPTNPTSLAPPTVRVSAPICYAETNDSILCLGSVRNIGAQAIGTIVLEVVIYLDDGEQMAMKRVTLPQMVIAPDGSAPYRALFSHATVGIDRFGGVSANVLRAEPADAALLDYLVFEDVDGTISDGVYRVTATLRNIGDAELDAVRVVVTVYDEGRRVLGFRAIELPHVAPDEPRIIALNVMPQVGGANLSHALHAEAVR